MLHEPQPISSQLCCGSHTVRGGIDSGDHQGHPRFLSWSFRCTFGSSSDPGMGPYLPRVSLARWLDEPQPISNEPIVLGLPHRAGRYLPGGWPLSSPVCWSCRHVKAFASGGGTLSSPFVDGSRNPSQSAVSQSCCASHTVQGDIDSGNHRFCPRFVGVVDVLTDI